MRQGVKRSEMGVKPKCGRGIKAQHRGCCAICKAGENLLPFSADPSGMDVFPRLRRQAGELSEIAVEGLLIGETRLCGDDRELDPGRILHQRLGILHPQPVDIIGK